MALSDDMKLLYVANARIPTEKAHGIAMMKACEAFARIGITTTLIVARRANGRREEAHLFYGVENLFPIRRMISIDLFPFERYLGKGAYVIQALTFYLSLFFFLLALRRDTIVYTREAPAVWLASILGFPAFLECHFIPERRASFLFFAQRARGIVAVASTIRAQFIREGFDGGRILAQPNAVDLSVFGLETEKEDARARLELPQDAFILGYTGNFTTRGEDKGLHDSLKALALLPGDFRLVAVGGSAPDIARYETEAEAQGVTERVRLIGYRPQSELALYQRAADVLLMPFPGTPYYREHMSPLKAFEYAASGRPIIATDLPTIREVLDDSTACLIPPDDPGALAKAAHEFQEDRAQGERLARAAFERVAQTHGWDARARSLQTFLKNLV